MPDEGREKRQFPREELLLKVQYPDREDFLHDCTENVSRGGTFIYSDKEWKEGERLRLVLSFPGLFEPLELMAEVTWVKKEGKRGIGVRFLFDKFPGTKERLEQLVASVQGEPAAAAGRKYRVLVAEENPFVQKLLKEGLEGRARRTFTDRVQLLFLQARSGYEGLEILGGEKIDLMICDLYLPVLDGFEMIRRVKAMSPATPVIAVSLGDEESERRALKLGADIFLGKPLVLSQLFTTICLLLKLGQN